MQNSSRLSNAGSMTQSTVTSNLPRVWKLYPNTPSSSAALQRRHRFSDVDQSPGAWLCALTRLHLPGGHSSVAYFALHGFRQPALCWWHSCHCPSPSVSAPGTSTVEIQSTAFFSLFLLSGVLSQITAEHSLRSLWPVHLVYPPILSPYSSSHCLRSSNLLSYLLLEPFPSCSPEPHLLHGNRTHSPFSSPSSETVLRGIPGLLKMNEGIHEKSSQEKSRKGTS